MAKQITKQTVRRRVRRDIATAKGRNEEEIRGIYRLAGRWSGTPRGLGFTSNGRLALLSKLNSSFDDVSTTMTRGEMESADCVRDIWNTYWEKMPPRHRR